MSIYIKVDLKLKSPQQMVSSDEHQLAADFIADRKFALKLIKHTVFEAIRVQVINQLVMYT